MLIKQSMVDALNRQVAEEFGAEAQYTAIALHFDSQTLPKLARYFYAQAAEEEEHALKLLHYINETGGKPIVPAIKEPQNHFENAQEMVQLALDQEMKVTAQINSLVDQAIQENDHLTRQFLQWFVTEQLEEVSTMTALLTTVKRAGEERLLLVEAYLAQNPREDAEG